MKWVQVLLLVFYFNTVTKAEEDASLVGDVRIPSIYEEENSNEATDVKIQTSNSVIQPTFVTQLAQDTVINDETTPILTEDSIDEDIKDIRPIVMLPWGWKRILVWSLLGLIVIFVIGYIIYRHRTHRIRKSLVPLDPYAQALGGIENARKYIQEKSPKTFANLLTDAVRQYLSLVFHLPAPECTTEEVLERIREISYFDSNLQVCIENFLKQCDIAKFTQRPLEHESRNALYTEAKQIVNYAEKLHQSQQQSSAEGST
ncbi:MAG: hypothetical protein LBJ78_03300 [Puniceicoccales bacterium]|jgi:hypothetical protein|nr:hypothetical protein [Puniceicoccales bacterium]